LTITGWFLIAGPVRNTFAERDRLADACESVENTHLSFNAADARMNAQLDNARAELDSSRIVLGSMADRNARSGAITRLATNEGMTIQSTTIGDHADGTWFQAVPITIVTSGDYEACLRFLRRVHENMPDVEVLGMELAGNPSVPTQPGTYTFNFAWYAASGVVSAE
jgi:hypothetical protein